MTPQEALKFFKDPVHANRLAHFVTGNYIPTAETRRAIGTLASAYLESTSSSGGAREALERIRAKMKNDWESRPGHASPYSSARYWYGYFMRIVTRELSALPPLPKKPMERERFIIVPDLALAVVDTSVSPAEVWCRMPTFGDSALDKAKKVCAALNAMFPVDAKEPQ